MKKYIKSMICLLLCALMLCSIAACGKDSGKETPADEKIPTTDTYIVKNGVSPYKVLIPEKASGQLQFAANDFCFFFKEATGVQLEIVTKADNTKGKYFSIGETAIKKASGVTVSYEELGNDGYKVKTYGDAVVMVGYTDVASTYAIYGFLGKQFGLENYGEKVYKIEKTEKAKLVDLDWTDVPDIPFRCGGNIYTYYGTTETMSRMRMRTTGDGWGLVTHTYFTILPPSKYLADHPDWYDDAESPLEVCQTNEEMKAQFIENLEQIILDTPECIYYMLGHEDGGPLCKCQNCQAVRDQYGGFNSALMIIFTNDVVRKVNEWAKETIPDRALKFCTFAYTTTEIPPVEYDQASGTYYPYGHKDELMLEDNLGIMIAPIGTDISLPYMESGAKATFAGWDALTDNLYVWAYSAPFSNYMVPFDGFGSFAQNYKDYVNMGVEYVFEQGFFSSYVPNFHELRGYLNSKLMWDTSLDTETLVRDFMSNYYGAGWESIYEFYTLWRLRLTELQNMGMRSHCAGQNVQDWCQPELYPKALLDQYETLFDAALEANEAIKDTDPEKYEQYRDNIRADRCLIRYLELSIYPTYYDAVTYSAMIDEFVDICGIKKCTQLREGAGSPQELAAEWMDNLNNK